MRAVTLHGGGGPFHALFSRRMTREDTSTLLLVVRRRRPLLAPIIVDKTALTRLLGFETETQSSPVPRLDDLVDAQRRRSEGRSSLRFVALGIVFGVLFFFCAKYAHVDWTRILTMAHL
jgi:hypothetical protein